MNQRISRKLRKVYDDGTKKGRANYRRAKKYYTALSAVEKGGMHTLLDLKLKTNDKKN